MAKRPPIGLILLAGAATAAGAALTAYVVKRRKGKGDTATKGKAPETGGEPGIPSAPCPKCGAEVKKYEFFCPACGEPPDKAE